jgi:putative transposase
VPLYIALAVQPINNVVSSQNTKLILKKNEFRALLKTNEIQCSMSRKGDYWGNAVAESFFHTLKVKLIHGKTYNTCQEAKMAIFEYIEVFYNRQRRHS